MRPSPHSPTPFEQPRSSLTPTRTNYTPLPGSYRAYKLTETRGRGFDPSDRQLGAQLQQATRSGLDFDFEQVCLSLED